MKPTPIRPKANQESVWDYPRPPLLERVNQPIQIVFNGVTIVDADHAYRVLETSHPPTFYLPPTSVTKQHLHRAGGSSLCEWKGQASYYTVAVNDRKAVRVAWTYHNPTPQFGPIKDYLAFYAGPMDGCYVNGERVTPQPGCFYGGWITSNVVGPFKGEPGSRCW